MSEGKMTTAEITKIMLESAYQHLEDSIEFLSMFNVNKEFLAYYHMATKSLNDYDFCISVYHSLLYRAAFCAGKENPYVIGDLVNRGFIPYEVIGKYGLVGMPAITKHGKSILGRNEVNDEGN